jgi:hypothetical protein
MLSPKEAILLKLQIARGLSTIANHPRNPNPETTCTAYEHHVGPDKGNEHLPSSLYDQDVGGPKDQSHYNSFSMSLLWLFYWIAGKWTDTNKAGMEWDDSARYILITEYTKEMMNDPNNVIWSDVPCPPEDTDEGVGPFYLARSASEVLLWGPLDLHRHPANGQPHWALVDTFRLLENKGFQHLMKFLWVRI